MPWRGSYRRMSHKLLGLLNKQEARSEEHENRVHLGNLMRELGDQSFGWGLLLFAIVNLLPVPLGTNMILGIPLIIIATQMIFGYETVKLPGFLARRTIPRNPMKRTIARMRPIFRRLERLAKPRREWIFAAAHRPALGVAILILAFALAAPIPTSGWFPAMCIFIIAFGMVERDGNLVIFGLCAGVVSLFIVVGVAWAIYFGIKTIAGVPI